MVRNVLDVVQVVLGSLCVAASIALFLAPNQVAPGGLTGLVVLFNHVTGAPIGVTLVVANAVLLAFGARHLGAFRFVAKTILSVVVLSAAIEWFGKMQWAPTAEPLLLAAYGGVLDGLGVAVVFRGGGTTGGVEIIARLVNRRFGTAPGVTMLSLNVAVYALAATLLGLEAAMLALLVSFVAARTLDAVTQGLVATRTVLIVTQSPEELVASVVHDLGYGVTRLDGRGGYTDTDRTVLLTVVPRMDAVRLRRRVIALDDDAFLTFLPSRGVVGGFAVPAEA